jgi:hypothetical protein
VDRLRDKINNVPLAFINKYIFILFLNTVLLQNSFSCYMCLITFKIKV